MFDLFIFYNMMGLTGPVIYCHCHCHCQRTECTDLLWHSKELLRVVVHHTNIVHCSEIINLSQIIHILFYLRFTLGYTITSRHAHAYTTHTHTHTHTHTQVYTCYNPVISVNGNTHGKCKFMQCHPHHAQKAKVLTSSYFSHG